MDEQCENRSSFPNDKLLNMFLNNDERVLGSITSLKIVGDKNLICFKFPKPTKQKSLVALRMIGDSRPPTPAGASHIVNGDALIQSVPVKFSLFRLA